MRLAAYHIGQMSSDSNAAVNEVFHSKGFITSSHKVFCSGVPSGLSERELLRKVFKSKGRTLVYISPRRWQLHSIQRGETYGFHGNRRNCIDDSPEVEHLQTDRKGSKRCRN